MSLRTGPRLPSTKSNLSNIAENISSAGLTTHTGIPCQLGEIQPSFDFPSVVEIVEVEIEREVCRSPYNFAEQYLESPLELILTGSGESRVPWKVWRVVNGILELS